MWIPKWAISSSAGIFVSIFEIIKRLFNYAVLAGTGVCETVNWSRCYTRAAALELCGQ